MKEIMTNILYHDNSITVCVKPAELLSEPDGSGNDIITHLNAYYTSIGEKTSVFPVHRLDFGVGGVMLFANSRTAAAKLCAAVSEHKISKEYLAVLTAKPQPESGTYRDLLFRDAKKNKSFVVKRKRAGVREASLEYRLVGSALNRSPLYLVLIKLHTGRTHQIRVQFSSRGMPLCGDKKYGDRSHENSTGIALWSYRLSFSHPESGENMVFSYLPHDGLWKLFKLSEVF